MCFVRLRFIRKIFGKNTKNNLKYYKIYFKKSVYKYFFKYKIYFNILVVIPDPAFLDFDCLIMYYLLIIAIHDSTFLYNNIHVC